MAITPGRKERKADISAEQKKYEVSLERISNQDVVVVSETLQP